MEWRNYRDFPSKWVTAHNFIIYRNNIITARYFVHSNFSHNTQTSNLDFLIGFVWHIYLYSTVDRDSQHQSWPLAKARLQLGLRLFFLSNYLILFLVFLSKSRFLQPISSCLRLCVPWFFKISDNRCVRPSVHPTSTKGHIPIVGVWLINQRDILLTAPFLLG